MSEEADGKEGGVPGMDANRGYRCRIHPALGVEIYMYKDDPGVFLNAYGSEVDKGLASDCGYDVEKLLKMKQRKERISQAVEAVESELKIAEETGTKKVFKSRDGFSVIELPMDRFMIEDPDGLPLTNMPLTKAIALSVFDQMVPPKSRMKKVDAKVNEKVLNQKETKNADTETTKGLGG
jgi:hypothetical protein